MVFQYIIVPINFLNHEGVTRFVIRRCGPSRVECGSHALLFTCRNYMVFGVFTFRDHKITASVDIHMVSPKLDHMVSCHL